MASVTALFTILLATGGTSAQSLHQRYQEAQRAEKEVPEVRDPLNAAYVAREKLRGFQTLVSTMVGTLAKHGFYVDRPRLLAAAIVPTPNLEVAVRSHPANGRGQIIQEIEVIYVRNDQVCRMTGWVTTLSSLSQSMMQRFIERSIYPHVIVYPDACVEVPGGLRR